MEQENLINRIDILIKAYKNNTNDLGKKQELGNLFYFEIAHSKKEFSKKTYTTLLEKFEQLPKKETLFSRAFLNYKINNESISFELFKLFVKERLTYLINNKKDYLKVVQFYNALFVFPKTFYGYAEKEIAKKITKKNDLYYYIRGLHYYYFEETDTAKEYFVKAIMSDKENWEAYFLLADIYFQEQIWRTSISYYKQALKFKSVIEKNIKSAINDFYFNLAWAYSQIKDYKNEEKAYKECLKRKNDYPYANNNLGYCLYKQKKYEEALKYLDYSIKLGTDELYPYWNKIRIYKALKQFEQAKEVLLILKNKKPNNKTIQKELVKIESLIHNTNFSKKDTVSFETKTESVKHNKFATQNSSFYKEKMLEDLIEDRINKNIITFDRQLIMYDNDDKYGRQFATDNGIIDLLTIDTDTNDLVVIELKKGEAGKEVTQQISRYISFLEKNIITQGQNVKGIICINKAKDELKKSLSNNDQIEVFEYSIEFSKVN